MRMYYIADFENAGPLSDMWLAKAFWRGVHKLRKIENLPVEAIMFDTICVLVQRSEADEWVTDTPQKFGKPSTAFDENDWKKADITVVLNPEDDLEKLLDAFEGSFNKSTKTIMALLRDWRVQVKAKKNG